MLTTLSICHNQGAKVMVLSYKCPEEKNVADLIGEIKAAAKQQAHPEVMPKLPEKMNSRQTSNHCDPGIIG